MHKSAQTQITITGTAFVKLVKIRFTSWRDQSVAPRAPELRRQLDYWIARVEALSVAAENIKEQQAYADSEALQKSLTRITTDLENIDAARMRLLSAEGATPTGIEHEKAGTFGYQIFNKAGTYVAMIVNEAGEYLPVQAVYSYELVDENPPRPKWATKGKFGN